MGIFSKDTYQRKAEYAYKISNDGIEKIASSIIFNKLKIKNFDSFLDNLEAMELTRADEIKKIEELENTIKDLAYKLEPIQELSHARHNMHSISIVDDSDVRDAFDSLGTDYLEGDALISICNNLNKVYNLSTKTIDSIYEPSISFRNSPEDILDYLDVEYENIDSSDIDYEAQIKLEEYYRELQDNISSNIRHFFKSINRKFGTNFPS